MPSVGVIFNFARPSSTHLTARRARSLAVTYCTRNFSNSWFLAVADLSETNGSPKKEQGVLLPPRPRREKEVNDSFSDDLRIGDRRFLLRCSELSSNDDRTNIDDRRRGNSIRRGISMDATRTVLSLLIRSARWQLLSRVFSRDRF